MSVVKFIPEETCNIAGVPDAVELIVVVALAPSDISVTVCPSLIVTKSNAVGGTVAGEVEIVGIYVAGGIKINV